MTLNCDCAGRDAVAAGCTGTASLSLSGLANADDVAEDLVRRSYEDDLGRRERHGRAVVDAVSAETVTKTADLDGGATP